jgi:hypothetical protein
MMLSRIIQITDGRAKSSSDVDTSLSEFGGSPLEIAQIVRFAMLPYGMYPDRNSQLLAAARQYGGAHATESPRVPGTILLRADGSLALALDQVRTIESYGLALCIVAAPDVGRYLEAWEVPGVVYWGGM